MTVFVSAINISEGRDLARLDALARHAGSSLVNMHTDAIHHRSVFTLLGERDKLLPDLFRLCGAAYDTVRLGEPGVHPRLGVVDVVPFVALSQPLTGAVALRDEVGSALASRFNVGVFAYGPRLDGERTLPELRRRAYVDWWPDWGPVARDNNRGATCVGAREILVAWNIWLRDTTVRRTKEIAASLRREGLRTLGLAFGDYTQVSCNLTDVSVVTPSAVLDATRAALRDNENVVRCELVGLAPASLVAREPADRLDELDLSWETTIENFLP